MTICKAAVGLIVSCEVTDERTYKQLYAKPTWPGGESGVTIGIGYDLGYATREEMNRDWVALSARDRELLEVACGKTGDAAALLAPSLKDVVVPYAVAYAVFERVSLPKYAAKALKAFPGAEKLPPECFGALVSLTYNRGTAMDGDRRAEMRAIRDLIAAGRYEDVPKQFRAMKRLWSNGLRDRREKEAVLWECGLVAKEMVA